MAVSNQVALLAPLVEMRDPTTNPPIDGDQKQIAPECFQSKVVNGKDSPEESLCKSNYFYFENFSIIVISSRSSVCK
jgi:hypothetical protein